MTSKIMKAEEIARVFLHEMNPVNWDGQGEMPVGVDTRTLSFSTNLPDVRLEISLELAREDDGQRMCCRRSRDDERPSCTDIGKLPQRCSCFHYQGKNQRREATGNSGKAVTRRAPDSWP